VRYQDARLTRHLVQYKRESIRCVHVLKYWADYTGSLDQPRTDLLRALRRPEYFFHPQQLWRRARRRSILARNAVRLAWGLPVELNPDEHLGVDVINVGVHDIVVPEAIWRLLDPGELAYDIGANIGQNASIMALRLGREGHVAAFEPGTEALRLLAKNTASWDRYNLSPITVVPKGLSSRDGVGILHETFELGGFSLEEQQNRPLENPSTGTAREIDLITLDEYAGSGGEIALMKIDVEGHELPVLQGASQILSERRVRDILYEDYQPQPSPVSRHLQSSGYEIGCLYKTWRRPGLAPLDERANLPVAEVWLKNFLATRDPARAYERFKPSGWKCLTVRARLKA